MLFQTLWSLLKIEQIDSDFRMMFNLQILREISRLNSIEWVDLSFNNFSKDGLVENLKTYLTAENKSLDEDACKCLYFWLKDLGVNR